MSGRVGGRSAAYNSRNKRGWKRGGVGDSGRGRSITVPTPPNPSPVGNARILLIVNICVFSRRVHQKGRMQCVNNLNLADRRRKHFKSSNGVPRENRKQKSKVENENKQGPDWSVVQRCSPSFIRFRENKRFTAQFQNQNVDGVKFEKQIENMNSSNSARPTGQRRTRQKSHQDRRIQHPTHS